MKLTELAFSVQWPFGLVIDDADIDLYAVAAARHYLGWGRIASLEPLEDDPDATPAPVSDFPDGAVIGYYGGVYGGPAPGASAPPPPKVPSIKPTAIPTPQTEITNSEWALIRPLYLLYVERANAVALEASRTLGVEVFGRTVDQVQADIVREEQEIMPRFAFTFGPETI